MISKTLCYIALPLVFSLSACSSLPESNGVTKENDRMFTNEVNYPDWYASGGGKDKEAIYSVGSEYSNNFQFSVDKAMLSAKRELAANFSSHISTMMKDFTMESGMSGDVASTDLDRTTRLVVSRTNLVGVQRTHFKVVHEGKGYRTFVKLRYSTDESNRLLMAEIRKNQQLYARLQSSKSFKELDEQIQQIENQKIEEIKAMTGGQ